MGSKIAILGICIILLAIGLSIWVDSDEYPGQDEIKPKETFYLHLIIHPGANATIKIEADDEVWVGVSNLTGYSFYKNQEEKNDSLITLACEKTYYGNSLHFDLILQVKRYVLIIFNPHDKPIDFYYSTQIKWRPFAQVGMLLSVGGVLITVIVLLQSRRRKPEILHVKQPFTRNYSEK
ncbi:MAG: hypothetical protein ACFFCW_47815 [Candidatus Hodarchaeota archaeon]